MTHHSKSGGQSIQPLHALAFVLVFGLFAGFAAFAGHVSALEAPATVEADGIIVLTGGEGRVQTAVTLLEEGVARRLLVSGVNPAVSAEAIQTSVNIDPQIFACCIDLGREAADTVGNARESVLWAETNGFHRIIIVTSDYHMPRAVLELRALMPNHELVAWPVRSPRPWENSVAARRWALEYLKFTAVFFREMARGAFDGESE